MHPRLRKQFANVLAQNIPLALTILFVIGISLGLWNMNRLSEHLIVTQAQYNTSLYLQTVNQARTLYADIASHAQIVEGIQTTETSMAQVGEMNEGEIPLPITFLMDLSERVNTNITNAEIRIYSDLPFFNREGVRGIRNNFEQRALDYLREYPERNFGELVTTPTGREYRYAQADVMKPSCLECHNHHPDSPKKDWQAGDVRGVLEAVQPLDIVTQEVRRGLRETLFVLVGLAILGVLGITLVVERLRRISEELEERVVERTAQLQESKCALIIEQEKSEQLLLNILPPAIATELKNGHNNIAQDFDQVTVLFADIVGFTALSAKIPPLQLVELLNNIFSEFDHLAEQYGLEKIKTIGDAYMVVGGLPVPHANCAAAIADMALAMQAVIEYLPTPEGKAFQIRIGISTGPVVAGVIGLKKFSYDLWGDTVNVAARMESSGEPGAIQVTTAVYEQLRDHYELSERGCIDVKGRGRMKTYWLQGKRS